MVMSVIYIGEWLVDFGFTDIAVRNISQNHEQHITVLDAFTAVKVIQAVLAFGLVVFTIYSLGYSELIPAATVGGLALVFYGGAQIYRVSFRLNLTMYRDMLSETVGVVVMMLLVTVLSLKGATVTELVATHALARLIYLLGNMYFGTKDYRPRYFSSDKLNIFLLARQAVPLGLAGVLVSCYDSIYPIMISKLLDMEAVAHYTVAIRLVFPIVLVTQVIASVFYTPLTNYWSSDKGKFIGTQQNLMEITFFTSCGLFCLLFVGAEMIVSIFGEEMSETTAILRALSLAILARAVTTTMAIPVIICGGQRKTMWLTLLVVASSMFLVLLLVPLYGVFGAVTTYLIAEILLSAIPVIFISQKLARFRLDWFPIGKFLLATLLAVMIVMLSGAGGTFSGGVFSILLFFALSYLTGGISNRKIKALLEIVRIRTAPVYEMEQQTEIQEKKVEGDVPVAAHSVQKAKGQYKVAIACPGAGLVQRGFERMALDLFQLLRKEMDLTLYKGGGQSTGNEKRLIFITRNGSFLQWFPVHKVTGHTKYQIECLSFAISLLLAIRGRGFDIIHCTDPPLTRILYKLRAIFHLNFRLLYTEACAMQPAHYPPADHMQQISQVSYDEAWQHGIPASYMTLIPLGFYPDKFAVGVSKSDLRRKYAIPEDKFVILCVAAINRYHKRIDYLVDEIKSVNMDLLLWIDGSTDQGDPDLVEYARHTLGDRCRVTHLPSKCVGELYGLADLMVHTSLFEAFGLSMIEGASTGLPVLTHNAPHFRWLLNNEACSIDMSIPGELSRKVTEILSSRRQIAVMNISDSIKSRYDWNHLKQIYLDLYEITAAIVPGDIGVAHRFGLK